MLSELQSSNKDIKPIFYVKVVSSVLSLILDLDIFLLD